MADRLDSVLLAPMANVSAFTGLLLAGATAWGYFRHWWVLTKFALTFIQLYAGIFLLSPALRDSAHTDTVAWPQIAGASLMASALSFQAWLSIAKPGKKTPWSPAAKPPTAPTWVFVAGDRRARGRRRRRDPARLPAARVVAGHAGRAARS